MVTYERVHELFAYDGHDLVWKRNRGTAKKGNIAGSITPQGYRIIGVDYEPYLAHLLVWFFHYGYFPENEIDHINRCKAKNEIENLREVSRQCNARNCGNSKSNSSGVRGVYFYERHKVWVAGICVAGKTYTLGRSKDFTEAVLLRLATEQCLGWENCDSASPAYQYAVEHNLIMNF